MNISKDVINVIVILVLVASMAAGLFYVTTIKQQSEQNTLIIKTGNQRLIDQIIANQRVIIGNLTDHRMVTNSTIHHLDSELDMVLEKLNITRPLSDIDLNDTGIISGFGKPKPQIIP